MGKIAVWSDKYHHGWDGDVEQLESLKLHTVRDAQVAFSVPYSTDAHFTPGVIYKQGEPFAEQVRLNKPSLPVLRELGMEVLFDTIVLDIDNKKLFGDDLTLWVSEQINNLEDTEFDNAWYYQTRGGYRLIWSLESPLTPEQYLTTLARLRETMLDLDIVADELKDWTRSYRLPYVIRDGVKQSPTVVRLSGDNVLVTDNLKEIDYDPFVMPNGPAAPIEETEEGGRNEFLFKRVASRMRNTPWISEEMYLPILELYNDTYCTPPLPMKELEVIASSVTRYEQPDEEEEDTRIDRIQIKAGGMNAALQQTISVLASAPGVVYNRDSQLVWINHGTGGSTPRIEVIPKAALRNILETLVEYWRYKKNRDGSYTEVTIDCPKELVDVLDAQTSYPDINELDELILCPTLDPEGNLLLRRGYYQQINTLLIPDSELANIKVPEHPTREDAVEALAVIEDLLVDFPFEKPWHKSVAIASILTPIVRTAIDGPVPLVLFDSPTPGTGKSLLADLASIIASGQPASRMVWTREEEVEKRITALLSSGARTVLIDNADSVIGGPSLDAVITSSWWTGRELGKSQMLRVRSRAQWSVTGNNVQVSGDMARRSIRCFLDSNVENPESRTNFKYHDILQHAKKNRGMYVQAALTIAKAWIDSGEHIVGLPPLGSFEKWSDIVRSSLIWLGMADPVASQAAIKANDAAAIWGTALEAMYEIWGKSDFTAKDLYNDAFNGIRVGGSQEAHASLTASLEELLGNTPPSQKSISWIVKKWKGRVVNGYRLDRSDERHRSRGYIFSVGKVDSDERTTEVAVA